MSRWHVDAQCHVEPILGPKMVAKWVPKCSKIEPEAALKGDSETKLKKEDAESVEGAARELPRSTNWRVGTDFGALWDHFGTTLGPFWVPKIGPKAHWINVEGVYAQSLISNTPYTVLKDFGIQGPPQVGPKSIKNRFQNGIARSEIRVGGFDPQK